MSEYFTPASLVAFTLLLAGCDETMRSDYATVADARADGAVRRGWIPDMLPDSAFDITESHDLDTNTGEGSFRFEERDAGLLREKFQSLTSVDRRSLVGDQAELGNIGYHFRQNPGIRIAIHWQKREVRFWIRKTP